MATPVFPGATVLPDDPRYPTLVRGFNLRWVGTPARVVLCGDTDQVVKAVDQALADGLRITFRGGGHCYEDFVSGNVGGVIVDLSPMSGAYYDPEMGCHCVEGGATLWNVYTHFEREYDVVLPAGSCYSVGAGGHVTAGGYGLLARLHGLTVDYLYAVELVNVDADGNVQATVLRADAPDPAEQLGLWAHQGGGGGNFGIVTRFWFRELPPAPIAAVLESVAWNWSDLDEGSFAQLVTSYGEWMAANSGVGDEWSPLFALLHLTQNAGAAPQVVLTLQYAGTSSDPGRELLRAIGDRLPRSTVPTRPVGHHRLVSPSVTGQALPWLYASQTLNGSGPNRRGKYKSSYMNGAFPADQIEAMWAALSPGMLPNSESLLQIDSYGCQVNAVDWDATAVAQRSSVMKLQFQTYWTDPAQDDENLGWIRWFYENMYGPAGPVPDGLMDGCYVGYPDVDLVGWEELYYKGNYPRLQEAKAQWDPRDVFNHQQSIRLP